MGLWFLVEYQPLPVYHPQHCLAWAVCHCYGCGAVGSTTQRSSHSLEVRQLCNSSFYQLHEIRNSSSSATAQTSLSQLFAFSNLFQGRAHRGQQKSPEQPFVQRKTPGLQVSSPNSSQESGSIACNSVASLLESLRHGSGTMELISSETEESAMDCDVKKVAPSCIPQKSQSIIWKSPSFSKNNNPDAQPTKGDEDELQSLSPADMKEFALCTLKALDWTSRDIKSFTSRMGIKGFSVLANFHIACEYLNLPVAWGPEQIKVFLIYVNHKCYSASYLTRMWKTIKDLGKAMLQPISEQQEADFELVREQAKEVKDNKVPVSKKLLRQLCEAADAICNEYNAALTKVVFLAAWGGYMRVSEYSCTTAKDGNKHNLRADAVITSPAGLSFTFRSDKTSKATDPMKHRFVSWKNLPSLARRAFDQYDKPQPKKVYNYFCKEDGEELSRTSFLNLLDECLVLTDFAKLAVTPHGFRLGAASHDRLKGLSMTDILEKGRWGPRSKAIEVYPRPDLIVLTPESLWDRLPKYRRNWTHQRLCFLACSVVETSSASAELHPFQMALDTQFSKLASCKDKLPLSYPDTPALDRIATVKENRHLKLFLNKYTAEEARRIRDCASKSKTAAALRKAAQQRIRGASLLSSFSKYSARVGITENKQSQAAVKTRDTSIQTEDVVILTHREFDNIQKKSTVPVSGVVAVPSRTKLQEKIAFSNSSEKLFDVQSLGSRLALISKQVKIRRQSDPALKVARKSLTTAQKFQLRTKICRRISKRYRDHRNNSRIKVKDKTDDPAGPVPKSHTMVKLIEFFLEEVTQKGEQGLPVWMESLDPLEPSADFEGEVMQAYWNKPPNYENILKVQLHDGTFNRKILQPKGKGSKKKKKKIPVIIVWEQEDSPESSQVSASS